MRRRWKREVRGGRPAEEKPAVEEKPVEEKPRPAAAYDSIVTALTDFLYVLDTDGNLVKWNKVAEEVTGYSPEELMNKPALEFFSEEDRGAIMEGIARTFKEGRATAEGRLLTKDGRLIPYAWTGAVLGDAKGEIMGMTGIGRDISELKRAEEERAKAVAEAEAAKRTAAIVDAMADGVMLFNPDGKIISINPALAKMIGIERSEAVGKNLIEVMPKYIKPEDLEKATRALEAGLSGKIEKIAAITLTLISRDGREVPVALTGSLIKDRDGKIIALIGAIKDITELKRAEEERAKAAAEAAAARTATEILESTPEGITILDLNGDVLESNPTARRMMGYKESQVGEPVTKFIAERDVPRGLETMKEFLRTGVSKTFECNAVRADGTEFPVSVEAAFLKDAKGKPNRIMLTFRDMTEYKRLEDEREKADKRRIRELEKFSKVAVGRELRMVELKKRIKELEVKLGVRGG